MSLWRVIEADVRDGLRQLETGSVHMAVTSVPYWGLRSYGTEPQVWRGDADCAHEWLGVTPVPLPPVGNGTASAKQVTNRGSQDGNIVFSGKPGSSKLASNSGANYVNGSSAFCRCGAWRGELGLEPDPEMWIAHLVAVFREVRRVLRDDGTLWLNVGDAYSGGGPHHGDRNLGKSGTNKGSAGATDRVTKLSPKSLLMLPARLAIALQADGWLLRSEITLCKVAPMPESVRDRPTSATERLYLFAKESRYYWDQEAVREPLTGQPHAPGNKAADDWQQIRGASVGKGMSGHLAEPSREWGNTAGRNLRNWWEWRPEPSHEEHYAAFPTELPRRCILAGTSERGCCAECGAPWRRVTERKHYGDWEPERDREHKGRQKPSGQKVWDLYQAPETISWEPSCRHDAAVEPCTVLDPFAGTATTGVATLELGRRFVGVELLPKYARIAERRLSRTIAVCREEHLTESESPQQVRLPL